MNLKIYIDGNFYDQVDAKISVFDHGLLYGDGVFEGIRFYNDRVFRLDEHIDRLWDSARVIALELPMSKSELIAAILETIRQNDLHDGYIRLIVTRGMGSLGLSPDSCRRAKRNYHRRHHRALSRGLISQGVDHGHLCDPTNVLPPL